MLKRCMRFLYIKFTSTYGYPLSMLITSSNPVFNNFVI